MTGCGTCPEPAYLLLENGEEFELEDGGGCILLEDQVIGHASSPWKSQGSVFLLFVVVEFVRQLFDRG